MQSVRIVTATLAAVILFGSGILTAMAPANSLIPDAIAMPNSGQSTALLPVALGPIHRPNSLGFLGPSAPSKPLFLESERIVVGGEPISVAVGDFNGDGKEDFAFAGFGVYGAVNVYLGNGDGTFQHPIQYMTGTDQYGIAVGDFNGDGKQDLAVGGLRSHSVTIFLGNGDGTFRDNGEYYTAVQSSGLVIGDFNGDGKQDIATVNGGDSEYGMSILFGRGDGTFKPSRSLNVGGDYGITSGDFNHDGKLDLAITTNAQQGSVVGIFLGTGGGNFAAPVYYPTGFSAVGIAAADLRGDGKLDLVTADECDVGNCANATPGLVSVLLGNGDGTFQPHVDYPTGLTSMSVATADFNGDGKLDLVVGNYGSVTVSVLLGNGDGTFNSRTDYGTDVNTFSVAVADFNGDGLADIVAANELSLSVLLANSAGGFQARADYVAGNVPLFVTARDFKRGGNVDLAVAASQDNAVAVLLGNGNGTFQQPVEYPVGFSPSFVEAGDFNGDGNLDLAVLACTVEYCQGPSAVFILLGNGDGTFKPSVSYPVEFGASSLTMGDFNGDGKIDLAVVNSCGDQLCNDQIGTISILFGNGDGTFQGQVEYPVQYGPNSIVTADFNNDGILDLAVANDACTSSNCGAISLLLGNGNGMFQQQISFPAGNYPHSLGTADLNGDGKPDLVFVECPPSECTINNNYSVAVMLGNGDGGFVSPKTFTAPPNVFGLKIADLNGDGIPDVAVTSATDNTVAVFFGKGNGNLTPYTSYLVGSGPRSVTAADVNNDGKSDLITSNWVGGSTISVLLNIGGGNKRH